MGLRLLPNHRTTLVYREVANFIRDSALHLGSMREDAVTDVLLVALAKRNIVGMAIADNRRTGATYPESSSFSDFLIRFTNGPQEFRVFYQAKKLELHANGRISVPEIAHEISEKRMVALLEIDFGPNAYTLPLQFTAQLLYCQRLKAVPAYIFYGNWGRGLPLSYTQAITHCRTSDIMAQVETLHDLTHFNPFDLGRLLISAMYRLGEDGFFGFGRGSRLKKIEEFYKKGLEENLEKMKRLSIKELESFEKKSNRDLSELKKSIEKFSDASIPKIEDLSRDRAIEATSSPVITPEFYFGVS